jgi:acyl-CoA synthetase (AMP-forming)/AMP-acid ligase II/acyl carrier protein
MNRNVAGEILSRLEKEDPNRIVFTYVRSDGADLEYASSAVAAGIRKAVGELRHKGIRKADVVLIVPQHDLDTVLIFLALIHMGARPCILPYFTYAARRQLFETATDAAANLDARWLVAAKSTLSELEEHGGLPTLVHVDLNGFEKDPAPSALSPADEGSEYAYLQLTSGTTGRSRAIGVTHDALEYQLETANETIGLSRNDIFVGWLPLNHDMGLISQVMMPLFGGARSVLISPSHWISDPGVLLKAISRYRGTINYTPNFGLVYSTKRIAPECYAKLDLSSWRLILNGAEMVRPESIENFNRLVARAGVPENIVVPGYGLGENVLAVSVGRPNSVPRTIWIAASLLDRTGQIVELERGDADAIAIVSCGFPMRGTGVRILGEEGECLPDRQAGEIAISGRSLCPRYVGASGAPIDSPEGFATGDIGFLDKGEVFICGRKKELAIIAGRNINPTVVAALAEKCLGNLHRRAAAFSVYSERIGTEAIVIVCETTRKLTPADATAYTEAIRKAVAESLQIAVLEVLFKRNNWLPRTTSGKVSIAEARKKYICEKGPEDEGIDALPPGDERAGDTVEQILLLASRAARSEHLDPGGNLFEQGLDSLAATELLTEIEKSFGVRVSDVFFDDPTIDHLVAAVASTAGSSPGQLDQAFQISALPPRRERSKDGRFRHFLRYGPRRYWKAIDYRTGFAIQKSIVSSSFARNMFAEELLVVDRWHRAVSAGDDLRMSHRQSMIANSWTDWRNVRLSMTGDFQRLVGFSFPPRFLEERDRSRGIIVVFPHVANLYWPLNRIIREELAEQITIIRHQPHGSTHQLKEIRARAIQVRAASNTLRRGGALMIAGDGLRGNEALEVPFLGKSMPFQKGAAELALATNSYLLPVFPEMRDDGGVTYTFSEPIQSDAERESDSVVEMTRAYARLYEERFRTMYAQMGWVHLGRLLEQWQRSAPQRST